MAYDTSLSTSHVDVSYPGFGSFKFRSTNSLTTWRAKTFLTKEPTTLEWLQSLSANSILVEVGSNIGIYTIPAALFHVHHVIAIEPEPKNYHELIANLELNNIDTKSVTTYPCAIVRAQIANTSQNIYLTSDDIGASCHQVGQNVTYALKPLAKERKSRSVYSITLSSVVAAALKRFPGHPIHLKVDVDGIEYDVLSSLFDDYLIHSISTLQIELNPNLSDHSQLISRLIDSGYIYSEEQVARARRQSGNFKDYAEYVFHKYIPQQCYDALPQALQQGLKPIKSFSFNPKVFPKKDLPSLTFSELSVFPPAFAIDGLLTSSQLKQAYKAVLSSVSPSTADQFTFYGTNQQQTGDSNRRLSSLPRLQSISPSYLSYISRSLSDRSTIRAALKCSAITLATTFSSSEANIYSRRADFHLFLRLRHFLDLRGFSLSRHNDSKDTLLALICPLLPYLQPTHLARISNTYYSPDLNSDNPNSYPSDFSKNKYYELVHQPGILNSYVQYDKKSIKKPIRSYTSSPAPLLPGQILCLPNVAAFVYEHHNCYKQLPTLYGHLVPQLNDTIRPVLLADYLIKEPDFVEGNKDSLFIKLGPLTDYI